MNPFTFEQFGLNARLLTPPRPMGRIHHHQEVEMNYLFSGGVTYLHRWEQKKLPLNRLTVFWGAIPHNLLDVEPQTEMAWITVPLTWLHQWKLPRLFLSTLMEGQWLMDYRSDEEVERYPVRSWVRELALTTNAQTEPLLFEIRACLLRMATGNFVPVPSSSGVDTPHKPTALRHIEKMTRYMAEHYSEDINVTDIARAASLHPKYAMPLFCQTCGLTIRDYLQQHRLTHAQRELVTTSTKVLHIALASGFRSQSSFYEAFTRATGRTPLQFRSQQG